MKDRFYDTDLADMHGNAFHAGDKVARAKTFGRSAVLAIEEVTRIEDGKLYTDDSKVAIRYPGRLLIITPRIQTTPVEFEIQHDDPRMKKILVVITELFGPGIKLTADTDIYNDLGGDSLDMIELVMSLEDEFNIDIFDDEIESLKCVKDILALVNTKLA